MELDTWTPSPLSPREGASLPPSKQHSLQHTEGSKWARQHGQSFSAVLLTMLPKASTCPFYRWGNRGSERVSLR